MVFINQCHGKLFSQQVQGEGAMVTELLVMACAVFQVILDTMET